MTTRKYIKLSLAAKGEEFSLVLAATEGMIETLRTRLASGDYIVENCRALHGIATDKAWKLANVVATGTTMEEPGYSDSRMFLHDVKFYPSSAQM